MAEKVKTTCPDCGATLIIEKDEDGKITKRWVSKGKKKGEDDDKGLFDSIKEIFTE